MIFLVRHAKALGRSEWSGGDRLRPLSPGGYRQAHRLAELLEGAPLARLLVSPALRCRQTLEPLAARIGCPLEVDDRLGEGRMPEPALALVRELGRNAAVCSHGDVIPAVLQLLERGGAAIEGPIGCEKGSVWIVDAPSLERATYLPPPTRSAAEPPSNGVEGETGVELTDMLASSLGSLRAPGEATKQRIGVLDLGSTSFNLVVADTTPGGEVRRVLRERERLRLGSVIAVDRTVPEEICRRAVKAAKALRRHAAEARVDQLLPVATAALREATNGPELAARIGRAVGVPVRVLSGEQEARLIFGAFRHRIAIDHSPALGLDLGGGSLELAIGDDDDVHWETTLPVGVARLHGELVKSDPLKKREEQAIRGRVREELARHLRAIERLAPERAVAAGGTVGALARRIVTRRTSWPSRSVGHLFVPVEELRQLSQELIASSHEERMRTPGLARQRADLLPTGAIILDTLATELGLEGLTVCDWGLREGVILEALGLVRSGRRVDPEESS